MKQTGRLVVLAALIVSLACTGGSGSGTSGGAGGPASGTLKIAVIPKGTSHVFWQSIHAGAVKAAREIANAFANSRGRVIGNKLYPSGVAVNYTIDLAGWADREARLEWSLWSQTEGRPLPKPWLRNVITKEIKPKVDDGSFSGQFWIPAPPRRGDYVVHLTVYDSDHVEHGEAETEPPFH